MPNYYLGLGRFFLNIFESLLYLPEFYPKATYKWGHYRSNQNQHKSNNIQVLLQVLVSLMQYT